MPDLISSLIGNPQALADLLEHPGDRSTGPTAGGGIPFPQQGAPQAPPDLPPPPGAQPPLQVPQIAPRPPQQQAQPDHQGFASKIGGIFRTLSGAKLGETLRQMHTDMKIGETLIQQGIANQDPDLTAQGVQMLAKHGGKPAKDFLAEQQRRAELHVAGNQPQLQVPNLTPPPGAGGGFAAGNIGFTPQEATQRQIAAMTPLMTAQHDLTAQFNSADAKAREDAVKGTPGFANLTPQQQTQAILEARSGHTMALTPALRPQNKPGTTMGSAIPDTETDVWGKPIDPTATYRTRILPDGTPEYTPVVPTTREVWIPDAESPTKVSKINVDRLGNQVGQKISGVLPPSGWVPRETTSNGVRIVQQPDGSFAAVPVQTTSTSTRNIPGLTPPPGMAQGATPSGAPAPRPGAAPKPTAGVGSPNRIVGGKSLTPQERITWDQKLSAFDNTLDLAQRVQSNLGLVNSLIDAKKIEMQIDPKQGIIHAFVNRSVPMSKQEESFAGDVASLMEHINTLRGPLGATGFRGAEAWGALQAQRGNLMANPGVTRQVLTNTIKALRGQRQAIARGLSGKGPMPVEAPEGLTPPPGGSGMVQMKAPNGSVKPVPADQVEHYKSLGAVVVQ